MDEEGERIPLTISSAVDGLITVIYQKIGGTTLALDELNEGDCLHDFVGPLGQPTEVEDLGRVAVLGGGLGCAIALPVARALHEAGNQVDLIGGFKTKDIVILEEEMSQACTDLTCTSAPTTAPTATTVSSPESWRSSSTAGSNLTMYSPLAP